METRYYIEIGILLLIIVLGLIIHSITKKKLKAIDGFQGFAKKDENGTTIDLGEENITVGNDDIKADE